MIISFRWFVTRRFVPGLCALVALGAVVGCTPMSPTAGPSGDGGSGASSEPASPSASSSASAPADGVAACATDDLELSIAEAQGGAAAGSNYLVITFANPGSKACTLYGWPGVSLVGDGNGTQLGAPAVRVQSGERRTVTVEPGAQTTALLQVTEAGNYSAGECDPATADGLRIYVPDQKAAVYVERSTPACRKSGVKLLQIAPIGTSG